VARKPHHKDHDPPSEVKPQAGTEVPCEFIDPMNLAEESETVESEHGRPRPAPAPGVPMTAEEFERLKEKAKHDPAPPSKHGQEDPGDKK
jgi:hypothetical protein